MRFKNFRHLRKLPSGELVATVDAEYRKFYFFSVTDEVAIFSTCEGGRWRFLNSGEIIEGTSVDNLYTAYKIIQKL